MATKKASVWNKLKLIVHFDKIVIVALFWRDTVFENAYLWWSALIILIFEALLLFNKFRQI